MTRHSRFRGPGQEHTTSLLRFARNDKNWKVTYLIMLRETFFDTLLCMSSNFSHISIFLSGG